MNEFYAEHEAYMSAYLDGDSDASVGEPADWSRWPASGIADSLAAIRALGYADGYAETARQEGRAVPAGTAGHPDGAAPGRPCTACGQSRDAHKAPGTAELRCPPGLLDGGA